MPDQHPPCVECTYLVGAGRLREPHGDLVSLAKDSKGRGDVFRCGICECRWALGTLGWSRLVD